MQRSTKIILGSTIVAGGIWLITNQELRARLKGAKDSIQKFNHSQRNFQNQLTHFKKTLELIPPVLNNVNHDVQRLQFDIEPRLKKIQNRLKNLNEH